MLLGSVVEVHTFIHNFIIILTKLFVLYLHQVKQMLQIKYILESQVVESTMKALCTHIEKVTAK